MKEQEAKQTLHDIREMMSKSSRFMSLSGFSGIVIGIIAILASSFFCYFYQIDPVHSGRILASMTDKELIQIYAMALVLLISSMSIAFFMAKQRSKIMKSIFWSAASKHLFAHLIVPLAAGFAVCSILFFRQNDLVLPLSLLIYGLALFSSSQFTVPSIRNFGLVEMMLSVVCLLFPDYSVVVWTLGFGLLHVIYGAFMQINQIKD